MVKFPVAVAAEYREVLWVVYDRQFCLFVEEPNVFSMTNLYVLVVSADLAALFDSKPEDYGACVCSYVGEGGATMILRVEHIGDCQLGRRPRVVTPLIAAATAVRRTTPNLFSAVWTFVCCSLLWVQLIVDLGRTGARAELGVTSATAT